MRARIDAMIEKYPKVRYTHDTMTIRGPSVATNSRMIDTETGEVVARIR